MSFYFNYSTGVGFEVKEPRAKYGGKAKGS
jgi:hypothetical protein